MGKPCTSYIVQFHSEYIGMNRAPGEVKHLSSQRKRKNIFILRFRASARRAETYTMNPFPK
jgi:hypothetical protein